MSENTIEMLKIGDIVKINYPEYPEHYFIGKLLDIEKCRQVSINRYYNSYNFYFLECNEPLLVNDTHSFELRDNVIIDYNNKYNSPLKKALEGK